VQSWARLLLLLQLSRHHEPKLHAQPLLLQLLLVLLQSLW
jgi:hypothetical protein